ncbi:hypothetical protein PIROE2DRAFT_61919 [Piromyces sp. E2]|nr:hypothetical protein PIROE2DRAFT_61919 [Piromyces sp. E2]|eukprot:OUM62403.1 hypothetical protein PIROE2DRAFT_61919 [Piromyces sp. E2]
MKRQTSSQSRGNIPPRINTPNNQEFIQDYFSAHHQPSPFSPAKNIDNNMYNNMYYPNNQMIPQSNGPMYKTGVDTIDNYELKDNSNKQKWEMSRGMGTPTTPIHPVNEFNIPVQFQQPLMTPPPYMRANGPFMNGGHRGNEDMMVGMNHVMKDQNNNLLSPVVMENTGGAQNNKKANLYKTELCRSYEETGSCRYGSKCQFAHSISELRPVDRHPKYKTEMCKTFWEQGTCPYGKRCCFIHTPRDLAKKEDVPGHTPTTPSKNIDKKNFPDANATISLNKKKENSVDITNTLSEGEATAIPSEEGETAANRSRSGSDSATAASITEEIIDEPGNKTQEETSDKKTEEKEKQKSESNKEESAKAEETKNATSEKEQSGSSPAVAVPIKTNNKTGSSKGMASSFDPIAKTPTNQSFNYSTSFGGSMNMMGNSLNNNYIPRRKMSSPPQRQNQRVNNPAMNINVDISNNYNGILGMNSMSFQPTSPLDADFMFNNNLGEISGKMMGQHGMSTSLPANDILDEKMMYKLQNLNIQTTPPHTPVNGQRANQNNQNVMSPLSSSFNQNNIFMKQPLNINTNQNSSNLFLKQAAATASPFTPGTPSSFLSPKQTHMGLPSIPLIDDETSSLKGPGSVSGKGSDFGDDTKSNATEEGINPPSTPNNLFVKQAINTSKTGTPHSFLKLSQKPSTPKNSSFLPSTPQSISNGFLNNGCVSPLQSRMGTSLPTTPIHPNSFNPSAIDEIFSGNNTIVNDFSRTTSSGINVAASPFTPTNDLSQYMMQMSSARENSTGLENIKSPSQLFYRPSAGSLSAINTTPSMKSNGGFGSMSMGGIGMNKNRSESFDYGMLSPNGMNSFLSAGNPVSSPAASSFNNSFLNNKARSESVDFGQLGHFNKDNNMVGSMPTLSFLQSINEGVPDSPFSNHGSMHGSPLPSSTTTLNDLTSGMNDFIGAGRRKSFPESSLMPNRLPTVPEGRHPNIVEEEEEEEERLFNNNNLTDEGILKFSKEHFGLDDAHSKSLLGNQYSSAMDIKGSILGGNIFSPMSPSSATNNLF